MSSEKRRKSPGVQTIFSGNPFRKVTLETLKRNKTRTAVTIVGVILSTAMICAVTTFASSIQQYMMEYTMYHSGDWHGCERGVSYEVYEKVKSDEEIAYATYFQQLGYAKAEGSTNVYKPYIYLLGSEKGAEQVLPVHLLSGRYPAAADEILLPEHLESNGGVKYEIGDTLTLELGARMQDGYAMAQENPCYATADGEEIRYDEEIQVREVRTYTVVGFCERLYWSIEGYQAPGYTAFTIADEKPSQECLYDVYFRMKQPQDVYDYMENNNLTGRENTDLLMYSGVSRYDSFYVTLYSLAAIVILLIMFGSVSLIYNAFSISVSERTKQFGLLSSVGATKRQLRGMVLFEALTISGIGIPIGICAGIGGIGVTLFLLGDKFLEIGFPIKMRVTVSPVSVVAAVLIALVTVLISAWIPAKRATKISVIEAIRQSADIRAVQKTTKTFKWIYRLFGLSGMLADKYYKRSKKRYRATILSLFMSIVLFVSASAFSEYLMTAVNGGLSETEYDLWVGVSKEDLRQLTAEELMEKLQNARSVTAVTEMQRYYESARISREYLTQRGVDHLSQGEIQPEYLDESEMYMNIYIEFIDEASFQTLLKEQGLREQEYMDTEHPKAVVLDGIQAFHAAEGRFETTKILKSGDCKLSVQIAKELAGYHFYGEIIDENGKSAARYEKENSGSIVEGEYLDISPEEAYELTILNIGDVIYDRPFYLPAGTDGLVLLYPQSAVNKVFPQGKSLDYGYDYYLLSDNHNVSYQSVQEILTENGLDSTSVYDAAEQEDTRRSMILVIRVFAYGFIVLISLIAVANVFHTITTNINLRRREFAMLKSIGMADKDFRKMMNFECILYGARAILYGLPVSAVITFFIWRTMDGAYETEFTLPWTAIGVAVFSVFVVVFVTMMYAVRKVKKENIMDALKNENL